MTTERTAGQPIGLVGGWTVHWSTQLPAGVIGVTRWHDRTIWLDATLLPHEVPKVLMHELMHALHGPRGGDETEAELEDDTDRAAMTLLSLMGLDAFADPWGSITGRVA